MLENEETLRKFMQLRGDKKFGEYNETMRAFFVLEEQPTIPEPVVTVTAPVTAKKEVACKEIFVARYGKIYKRKAPSPTNCIKLNCAPGFRYCKLCDAHKPLVAFYTAVKRYVCRKCHKVKNNT